MQQQYPTYQEIRRRRAEARRRKARKIAEEAMQVLEKAGAKVALSGSLAGAGEHFDEDSDIDIVVIERPAGVSREQLYSRVLDLDTFIDIELIFLEDLRNEGIKNRIVKKMRREIESEGQ